MKLFNIWTNDGNWGGVYSTFVIADSKESALEKDSYVKSRIADGCDYFISEVSAEKLTHYLLKDSQEEQKYIINFTIEEK